MSKAKGDKSKTAKARKAKEKGKASTVTDATLAHLGRIHQAGIDLRIAQGDLTDLQGELREARKKVRDAQRRLQEEILDDNMRLPFTEENV